MGFLISLLKSLVSIPCGLFVLMGIGWLATRWRPRLGRWLTGSALATLVLLCVPWCAAALLRSLQSLPALEDPAAAGAQAVVILSADAVSYAPELAAPTVGRLTLERLRYGALLARSCGLPVLVTGGASRPGIPSRAVLMQRVLEGEFGVAVRWVEGAAANTEENGRRAGELLVADGVTSVLLVTHAWHMPRALEAFEATGLRVVAAPTAFRDWPEPGLRSLVPSARSLQESSWALHEWLGRLWARVH